MNNLAKSFSLTFIKKERIAEEIYSYFFETKNKIDFVSGQYMQLTLPHPHPDDRGTSRFFTIASSPSEEYVMIVSRKGRSSFKRALFDLKKGSEAQCFGPIGTFVLPEA